MHGLGRPRLKGPLVCHFLLVRASHKDNLHSRGGEIDSTCYWELLQSHIAKGKDSGCGGALLPNLQSV